MLILTRKDNESVILIQDDKITRITFQFEQRKRVKLLVDAPQEVIILREELIKKEKI